MLKDLDIFDFMLPTFDWDKDFYKFNRWEKDMNPYSTIVDEKNHSLILTHNIVGMNKEDLVISTKKEKGITYLIISGKTKDDITGKDYSINSRFMIDDKGYDLNKIEATAKNGLVYITIPCKKEIEKQKEHTIKIK